MYYNRKKYFTLLIKVMSVRHEREKYRTAISIMSQSFKKPSTILLFVQKRVKSTQHFQKLRQGLTILSGVSGLLPVVMALLSNPALIVLQAR